MLLLYRDSFHKNIVCGYYIEVKFSTELIPTVRIFIYIDLHLEILDFLLIFDFPASFYFVPLI